jgi:hypothetical protein
MRNFFTVILPRYGQVILLTASAGMFAGTIKDDRLKNQLLEELKNGVKLQKELAAKDSLAKELLEKSLTNKELLDMENSIEKIDKSVKSLNKLSEKLNSIKSNSTVDNTTNENINNKVLEEINNTTSEHINNIIDGNSILKNILEKKLNFPSNSETKNFISNFDFHDLLSGMSTLELGAVVHLNGSLLILFSLMSIISIIFGDELLKYLKLEEKFPRLARFIEIRRKFRYYYLILNFLMIIFVLVVFLYLNFLILAYKFF